MAEGGKGGKGRWRVAKEFWLIDAERKTAKFYSLVDGKYRFTKMRNDEFSSHILPGLVLPAEWVQSGRQPL